MGIPDNPLLLLPLLLPFVVAGGLPSFMNEDDYKQCDEQSCWWSTFDIELGDTDVKVPNTKIIAKTDDWDYVEVTLTSLLEECSPSLAPSQLAFSFTDCKDMKHDIEEICEYVKKGWLDDQGKIAAAFLETTFGGLEHASGYIGECMAWDGDKGDYDYYDDYWDNYDYDYYYLEESEADDERVKRDTSITFGETALRTGRIEREAERTKNNLKVVRKEKRGKSGRKGRRNGSNNGRNRGNKESKNNGSNTEQSGNKKHNKQKKNKKNQVKGKNHKRKGRKKDSNNKGNKKATKAEKKKEQEKKKEEEKKKALKKIGLKSLPTKSVSAQLWCIERAVERALEKCGEKHLRGVDLNNATIV